MQLTGDQRDGCPRPANIIVILRDRPIAKHVVGTCVAVSNQEYDVYGYVVSENSGYISHMAIRMGKG